MGQITDRAWLLIIILFGLITRLIYFFEYASLIEFSQPTVDALYHHLVARSIADGALTAPEPFFRAPFYNYFLGLTYWITSDSIGAARFIQLLIGAATAPLTFLIAREVCDKRVAILASILVLLCQDLVYFEAELLLESILATLILSSLWSLLHYFKSGGAALLAVSGFLAGTAVITRPNAAVLLIALGYLLWREKIIPLKLSRGRAITVLIVAALLPITLVLAHNLSRPQPAFTIATQGGINFYIGNNREADGVSAIMPGELGFNWQYEDIAYRAAQAEGRSLTPAEVSSHYYREAIREIAEVPGHWAELLVKKTYLFFSGADISNNRDLSYFKSQFTILSFLPFGMWLLAPLGLASLIFWSRLSVGTRVVQLFVLLYAASFVLFFVNSRFRAPLIPLLAIMAAGTLFHSWDQIRQRRWVPVFPALALAALLIVGLNLNPYGIDFDNRKQALFSKGNLYLRANSFDEALVNYREAAQLPGALKDLNLNIGVVYLKQGEYDSAWKYLLLEDSLAQGSAEALSNLAYLYRQTKQYDEAAVSAKLALEVKPYLEDARLNLWYAWRESGQPESVLVDAAALQATRQLSLKEKFIRAVSAADLGDFERAARELNQLVASTPQENQPRYADAASAVALSLAPAVSTAHLHYNLGYALAGMGDIDSAIVLFRKALDRDAMLQEAWINIGTAYLNKRRFDDATAAYQEALRSGPASEVLFYNLAIALLSRGDLVDGENYLRKALELNPEFAPARVLLENLDQSP